MIEDDGSWRKPWRKIIADGFFVAVKKKEKKKEEEANYNEFSFID